MTGLSFPDSVAPAPRPRLFFICLILSLMTSGAALPAWAALQEDGSGSCSVIEDFEAYEVGEAPYRWSTNKGRQLFPATRQTMTDDHQYVIEEERGNRFVRATMRDYAYRLIELNEEGFTWDLGDCPVLRWRWRVVDYPEGAREDDKGKNDVAAAVYVTFGTDWLGRPKSIKYTYSSTLPVGTVASYGPLKVLVVATVSEGYGEWETATRDVIADYEQLFGEAPKTTRPQAITLFSDADEAPGASAVADFDDVETLPSFPGLPR